MIAGPIYICKLEGLRVGNMWVGGKGLPSCLFYIHLICLMQSFYTFSLFLPGAKGEKIRNLFVNAKVYSFFKYIYFTIQRRILDKVPFIPMDHFCSAVSRLEPI